MKPKTERPLVEFSISTRQGQFIARYSESGLVGLDFPSRRRAETTALNSTTSPEIRRWHRMTVGALHRALSGRAPRILPPLDMSHGTPFQQDVWKALLKIPHGETRSYGEIAQSIRNPRAARAVGAACGANPSPIFVPCHRILATNKRLGGYVSGVEWKRKLLWREGSRDWWTG